VREAALEAGAWGCVISGAGPSLLALCRAEVAEDVRVAMVERWRREGVESRAENLGLQTDGSHWKPLPDRPSPSGG
jgi:homoserine kinase